jgi:hypothetical protein
MNASFRRPDDVTLDEVERIGISKVLRDQPVFLPAERPLLRV